jgi:hypothetical protein
MELMVNLIHCLFSKMSFLILPILTSYIMYFQITNGRMERTRYVKGWINGVSKIVCYRLYTKYLQTVWGNL